MGSYQNIISAIENLISVLEEKWPDDHVGTNLRIALKKRRWTEMTPELDKVLAVDYLTGASFRTLAERYRIDRSTVERSLRRTDTPIRLLGRTNTPKAMKRASEASHDDVAVKDYSVNTPVEITSAVEELMQLPPKKRKKVSPPEIVQPEPESSPKTRIKRGSMAKTISRLREKGFSERQIGRRLGVVSEKKLSRLTRKK